MENKLKKGIRQIFAFGCIMLAFGLMSCSSDDESSDKSEPAKTSGTGIDSDTQAKWNELYEDILAANSHDGFFKITQNFSRR